MAVWANLITLVYAMLGKLTLIILLISKNAW